MFKQKSSTLAFALLMTCISLILVNPAEAKRKQALAFLSFDGLHVDANGQRYAADGSDGSRIYKIDEAGFVSVFATDLAGPIDITSDSLGNIYVSNFNSAVVTKIEPSGEKSEFSSTNIGPAGIVADAEDNIYVANYGPLAGGGNTILKVSSAGEVSTYAEGGLIDTPVGLTIDEYSNLYVANFNNGKIIKITPDGEQILLATIPSDVGFAIGHLEYVNGRLFATGLVDQKIYIIRKNGRVRARDIVAEGEFPNGIAFDPIKSEVIFTNTFAPSFGLDRIVIPKH